MSERLVEIPVDRAVRERIKEIKGVLSYSQFLDRIITKLKLEAVK
jgi:hypothetical protein